MALIERMTSRPATLSDYDGVLDIDRTLNGGFDYLPAYYHIYLHDPHVHGFVGEIDGEIIAFAVYQMTDNNQTAIAVAGRVKPQLERQGIYYALAYKASAILQERIPSFRTVRHGGLAAKFFDNIPKLIKRGRAHELIIMKNGLLAFCGNNKDLKTSKIPTSQVSLASTISHDKALEAFDDTTNIVCLFPTGFLMSHQNGLPLRVTYKTVQDIMKTHYTVFTFRENPSGKLQTFSYSHVCKVPNGLRFDIYYYDVTHRADDFQEHIVEHVRHLSSVAPHIGTYRTLIHLPLSFDLTLAQERLDQILKHFSAWRVSLGRDSTVVAEGPAVPAHLIPAFSAKL